MANFVFNIAKGRVAELANRVNANDPTNSVFLILAYNTTATDATLKDIATVALVEADGNTAEVTNSGYARKVLDQSAGITVTTDTSGDLVKVVIPDQTWTAVATSPGAWTDLMIAYDSDSTGGADSAIVPLVWLDFAITPDGSDITVDFDGTNGVYQAS